MKAQNSCNAHIVYIVCILCIVCIVCIHLQASAQVKDNFSDGNFTQNPVWTGDTAQFEVNSAGQLHLQSTGSDTSVLITRNERWSGTEWSFWVKLSFNTSANNHAKVYLTSDTAEPVIAMNGYFLQIGGADDSIFIMKQAGNLSEPIYRFKSYKSLHSTNTMRFRITRDETGLWQAMIDTTGAYNYILDGSFYEDTFRTSRWSGVYCRYTTSNATKFYLDDFYIGPILHDSLPARIMSAVVKNAGTINLEFSEAIQKAEAENQDNYRFDDGPFHVDSVKLDLLRPDLVSVFLRDPLQDGTSGLLQIMHITDLAGNVMPDTIVPVSWYKPKAYDILINEIMADPAPPVELPDAEFVELYNRSAFPVNLEGWSIGYGSNSKVFPPMTISAQGYLLIVKDSVYRHFGHCAVMFTSSSSLSNEGTTLVLKNEHQHVIHAVSYDPDWYGGSFKADGGWSLEMIDVMNPCGCKDNWIPSKDATGGTPGRVNSVCHGNPDTEPPVSLRAVITDSTTVKVFFSEAMDSTAMVNVDGWLIIHPAGETQPAGIIPVPPDFSSIKLTCFDSFENGETYLLRISGILKDCAGNICDTSNLTRFAIPGDPAPHDVVVNEVLSNPASGGARFVELYNRSEKVIDLQALALSVRDTVSGSLTDALPLAEDGYILFPGEYVALTSDPGEITGRYRAPFPGSIMEMPGFPTFGDDTGTIILARKDNLFIIDRMKYNPDMHYPLLATAEGVSLERTSPDLPPEDPANWHSSAATNGFATPGYRNSHWLQPGQSPVEILVQPEVFSPDNDGYDDLMTLIIREKDADCAANIMVYDSRGRPVRQLANNVLLGSEGVFVWDGITEQRRKAPLGFYVLLIELTKPDGTVGKIKRTVVVGGKF